MIAQSSIRIGLVVDSTALLMTADEDSTSIKATDTIPPG
jgi:hypothetical protein